MLAYPKQSLINRLINQQATEAAGHGLITEQNLAGIKAACPVDLYTPNLFVRIGLGILTLFAVLAFFGLLAMITDLKNFGTVLSVLLVACYAMLELMTGAKKHFSSGVDNVLLVAVVCVFTGAVMQIANIHAHEEIRIAALTSVSAFLLAWRFADGVMAAISTAAFLLFIFFNLYQLTSVATQYIPAIVLVTAALLYMLARRSAGKERNIIYRDVWNMASIIALIAMYACCNFYVVFELSMNTPRPGHVAALSSWMAALYWTLTVLAPLAYVIVGIFKKDVVLLRLGIIAAAVSVLTFRYYHAVLAPEAAMILFGGLIILAAWRLIKKLAAPYHGFVSRHEKRTADELNIEGVLTAEVFGKSAAVAEPPTTFGRGSFGGAGAGSKY